MDFTRHYDVVVTGGGIAGVAAALECARKGLSTAIVEKTVFLGGLATAGLIHIYLPLCDGYGRQVITGLAEELFHLSYKYGPGGLPSNWRDAGGHRFQTWYSPSAFILALDEEIEKAGVHLWLDTLFVRPNLEGDRVTAIEVENKSGKGLLRAERFIDASGDADLLFRAGAETIEGQNWLSYWAHIFSAIQLREQEPEQAYKLLLRTFGGNNAGEGHPRGAARISGLEAEEITAFILDGRRMLREKLIQEQAQSSNDRFTLFPETLPAMAQLRTTRRIHGVDNLDSGQNNLRFETSLGLTGDWRKAGPVWEIPYGVLVPRHVRGVLAAGRCIAAGGDAWEVMRVIPPAALTGQLAGLASWLSIQENVLPDMLPASAIQAEQLRRGHKIHCI